MSFKFSFSGDDIEDDDNSPQGEHAGNDIEPLDVNMDDGNNSLDQPHGLPVVEHNIFDMLHTLPSQLSYITTAITSPNTSRTALIPRRALFDIRLQIIAESEDVDDSNANISNDRATTSAVSDSKKKSEQIGLGDLDVEKDVYEGGFKVWEGAVDLAKLLYGACRNVDASSLGILASVDNVVELGTGAALPTLILLDHHLANSSSSNSQSQSRTLNLTFTDYNALVLRLVTLPNLLLTYALHNSPESFDPGPPVTSPTSPGTITNSDGEINITPQLLSSFTSFLNSGALKVRLISGPWSPALEETISARNSADANTNHNAEAKGKTLILASEVLYSPSSTKNFSRTLLQLLRNSASSASALVASKKVYFGVGGSVADFVTLVADEGAWVEDLSVEAGLVVGGVGRCVLKVEV